MKFFNENLPTVHAMITHGWNRISYNILRDLGKRGLRVVIGMDNYSGMSAFSRYKFDRFFHPNFKINEKGFIKSVLAAISTYRLLVYMPSDEEIFIISKFKHEINKLNTKIPIPSFDALVRLHKKQRSVRLAESLGIPTPATLIPKNKDEIIDFSKSYNGKVVLKISGSSASRGVFFLNKVKLSDQLDIIMRKAEINFGDFIIQQFVAGIGYGVSMLMNQGVLRAKFTHKRLLEKIFTGGPSTVRVSIKNMILERYAEKILKSVGYHGVAMVEFKYDEQTKKGRFIEVNPRFWGSIALAICSGVNFPYLLYKMALEGDVETVKNYNTGVKVRWILGDVRALISQMLATRQIPNFRQIFIKVNGYDDYYSDDPLAFVGQCYSQIRKKGILKRS